MFLHLGVDTMIPLSAVIAILDIKKTKSKDTESYLKNKKNKIIDISGSNAKSFIITEKAVYYSSISPMTLNKRAAADASIKKTGRAI